MTALTMHKLKGGDTRPFCSEDCRSQKNGHDTGPKIATHRAEIMGHPAGLLCNDCVVAWQAMWLWASGGSEVAANPRAHSLGEFKVRKAA